VPSHVVEERLDVGLKPRLPVGGAHHLHISLSRLVDETKMRTAGRQLRAASTMATLIACAP
jgi:hypothetical protein